MSLEKPQVHIISHTGLNLDRPVDSTTKTMLPRERNSLRSTTASIVTTLRMPESSTMLLIQTRKKLLLGHIGWKMLKLFLKKPGNTMPNADNSAVLTEGGGMN